MGFGTWLAVCVRWRRGWQGGMQVLAAYPSARAGLAAAAPRAPPAASGAPGRPCQRREPAPHAAPARRAIFPIRDTRDTGPRLP
ncbi:jg11550 [Pararge aegeria aegeria]|uniref:Jg11550 protein n=1 Tax=Pararge aegeria aegeria TaxID=348720 RepID=A0A8S4RL76_9NEOP|nr:jg11550 [Pararge aegeria aegeria]